MVSCIHSGRLANILFQVAMVYAYAKKHGMDWCVPNDKYDELFPNLPYGKLPEDTPVYNDPKPHFFTEPPKMKAVVLNGYWQSYKYFEGRWVELADLFGFGGPMIKRVSIHIRRGDYLEWQEAFPVVPMSYYNEAIAAFKSSGITKFRVYSDDIPWCRKNFIHEGCEFEFSEGKTPLEDLKEMARCEHHIIANSSFSQWAALINPNPDKIVIAPHPDSWYGPKNKTYTRDMCPPDWITIKYSPPMLAGKKGVLV